jgi:hypothetical protein
MMTRQRRAFEFSFLCRLVLLERVVRSFDTKPELAFEPEVGLGIGSRPTRLSN